MKPTCHHHVTLYVAAGPNDDNTTTHRASLDGFYRGQQLLAAHKGVTMTGNLPDNPDGWAEKYPLARRTELVFIESEGEWLLESATEVGADV